MNVAIAYCTRDQDITLQLFEWIKELGGCNNHSLLLCHDARCSAVNNISACARESFGSVRDITARAEVDGWPAGANYMFKLCASTMEHTQGVRYFFWMEPDAIPLVPEWLDKIEAEYLSSGKPFMGDDVDVEIDGHKIPRHMSGVGVYQNPIHKIAGMINISNENAWDMVARNQILPNAHFTKLIEHSWRHPSFTEMNELKTQISSEAVLFHASKDGSLIKLLREQRQGGDVSCPSAPQGTIRPHSVDAGNAAPTVQPAGTAGITCDIFIRTYPKDYPWLKYCLQSINKYCSGFRKIWIISPEEAPMDMSSLGYEWKQQNEESPDGYLAQQIHKLYADVITDYQADYILFGDSDTLFTRPVTPQTFFTGDKPTWYMTEYSKIETPWKPIVEKFMAQPVEYEFMRRHPFMVPRWLFPKLREYCHAIHNQIISQYIANQPLREFSEFNALGAFAYAFHRDKFEWVNTLETEMPEPVVRQFWSRGGLTDEVKSEIETILGGSKETVKSESFITPVDAMNVPTQPISDGGVEATPSESPSLGSKQSAPSESPNGEMSVGDHVRALAEYADIQWKRQYVIRELKKAGLVPKYRRTKK